jgi:hypothetical protein
MKRHVLFYDFEDHFRKGLWRGFQVFAFPLILAIAIPIFMLLPATLHDETVIPFLPGISFSKEQIFGIIAIIVIIAVVAGLLYFCGKYKKVAPYENIPYVCNGIYRSDDLQPKDENGTLNTNLIDGTSERQAEVTALTDRLHTISKNNETLMLIAGKSGDGKSTILRNIERKSKRYVADSNYNTVIVNQYDDSSMIQSFKDTPCLRDYFVEKPTWENAASGIEKYCGTQSNPHLFILFDQFEDILAYGRKDAFEEFKGKFLEKLNGKKNIALLFCIREEYLSVFMEKINYILSMQEKMNGYGEFFAYKVDALSKPQQTAAYPWLLLLKPFVWNDDDLEKKLNKISEHESAEARSELTGFAKDQLKQNDDNSRTLAELQLVLYFIEREFKADRLQRLLSKPRDSNALIDLHFDRMLCMTNRYFEAMQIMYLLSYCAEKKDPIKLKNIKSALCAPSSNTVENILLHLYKNNLIKGMDKDSENWLKEPSAYSADPVAASENSNGNYQFSAIHDFIGERFISYASARLKSEVKQSLDYYCEYKRISPESNRQSKKPEGEELRPMLASLPLIIAIIADLVCFTGLVSNVLNDTPWISVAIIFMVFSLAYVYNWSLYFNALRIHLDPPRRGRLSFCLFLLPAIVSWLFLWLYQYENVWVFAIFGAAISIVGYSIRRLGNTDLTNQARDFIKGVGNRILVGGALIIFCVILFSALSWKSAYEAAVWWGIEAPLFLFVMLVITIYGIPSHLNSEYYPRIIGALNCTLQKTEK